MGEPIELRRKRLRHQSRYRGRLEADLVLGRFAERHLAQLDPGQLDRYEALLDQSDDDLLAWIWGTAAVPPEHDHDIFQRLCSFQRTAAAPPKPSATS